MSKSLVADSGSGSSVDTAVLTDTTSVLLVFRHEKPRQQAFQVLSSDSTPMFLTSRVWSNENTRLLCNEIPHTAKS